MRDSFVLAAVRDGRVFTPYGRGVALFRGRVEPPRLVETAPRRGRAEGACAVKRSQVTA